MLSNMLIEITKEDKFEFDIEGYSSKTIPF